MKTRNVFLSEKKEMSSLEEDFKKMGINRDEAKTLAHNLVTEREVYIEPKENKKPVKK